MIHLRGSLEHKPLSRSILGIGFFVAIQRVAEGASCHCGRSGDCKGGEETVGEGWEAGEEGIVMKRWS